MIFITYVIVCLTFTAGVFSTCWAADYMVKNTTNLPVWSLRVINVVVALIILYSWVYYLTNLEL